MYAVRSGDTIYIGGDFVEACLMEHQSQGKTYSVVTSPYQHSFMVRADTVDEAQKLVEGVYRKEGKRKPNSFRIQLT